MEHKYVDLIQYTKSTTSFNFIYIVTVILYAISLANYN